MTVRELSVPGAWEITPELHGDSRGLFFEWFTDAGFTALSDCTNGGESGLADA